MTIARYRITKCSNHLKNKTLLHQQIRERERERKKREEGGGEEGCQKVEKQEPIRAWDLVYDVIVRSSIPVALSYMFLFYLGESKH